MTKQRRDCTGCIHLICREGEAYVYKCAKGYTTNITGTVDVKCSAYETTNIDSFNEQRLKKKTKKVNSKFRTLDECMFESYCERPQDLWILIQVIVEDEDCPNTLTELISVVEGWVKLAKKVKEKTNYE